MLDSIPSSDNIPLKRCPKCPEDDCWYPATTEYFHRDKSRKDGLCNCCKECNKKKSNLHYHEHPEHYRNYSKTHRENINYHSRKYHRVHKREGNERARIYKKTHALQINTQTRNRHARKKAIPGEHTPEEILDQLKRQKYRCYYAACGYAKFERVKENGEWKYIYEVEHMIPVTREGSSNSIWNIVLACKPCNASKHKKLPHEWPEGGRLL